MRIFDNLWQAINSFVEFHFVISTVLSADYCTTGILAE
jgi:hypothetical protein